ncbi:ATP-dependent helicase [Kribbella sp. NPDC051718]|uniref:ATP-dependent helicase n=1 Tax=Kribbella sp. NPDC051718 TaxID=3155168 RepID=UPI00344AA247
MIPAADWQPSGGLVLEPNGLSAVTTIDRNVVVAAGPGAGKTELLAQRADFLLRTGHCPYPRRILAISFKVDAARNLRDRVRLRSGIELAARFDSFTFHGFAKRLVDNYRGLLTGIDALPADYLLDQHDRIQGVQITFDDLVPLALKILDTGGYPRGALRQTYSHVFLDEFQDTTKNQYALVRSAFAGTTAMLIAVGDVKQRIMVWAGALHGVLEDFADDFDALPLPLYLNRRSAPRLRRMQNRIVAVMDPAAVSPDEDLAGEEGSIRSIAAATDQEEAQLVADLIEDWLTDTPPAEIAVLVRQQPHLVAAPLAQQLQERGIPYRNEQASQDLAAEPVAAIIFDFIRVVAEDRQSHAYSDLLRLAHRAALTEEAARQFDSRLRRLLHEARTHVRTSEFVKDHLDTWKRLVNEFLDHIGRPTLIALSPSYQQGNRLDDVISQAFNAFGHELEVDGDPATALKRLSDEGAVRFLTIHKCKGLEFEKVIVLGVEQELFWGNDEEALSEFFVAISRAKTDLVLTHVSHRALPDEPVKRWSEHRTPYTEFLNFAIDS